MELIIGEVMIPKEKKREISGFAGPDTQATPVQSSLQTYNIIH